MLASVDLMVGLGWMITIGLEREGVMITVDSVGLVVIYKIEVS
jgi:hypothetical protein